MLIIIPSCHTMSRTAPAFSAARRRQRDASPGRSPSDGGDGRQEQNVHKPGKGKTFLFLFVIILAAISLYRAAEKEIYGILESTTVGEWILPRKRTARPGSGSEKRDFANTARQEQQALPGSLSGEQTIELPGGVKMVMAEVEAGSFEMSVKDSFGNPDEVSHMATLKHVFYIGLTEVTQAQWKAVMGRNPSIFKGNDFPVEDISWYDAMAFCENLNATGKAPSGWNFSLPTETQWEYAASGGKRSKGYKYSGGDDLDEVAWYTNNSDSDMHPVGLKKPNELGLYDMSGNVWEFCLDDWSDDSSKQNAEFTRSGGRGGPYRVIRGGSWSNLSWDCRPAKRNRKAPIGDTYYRVGFRVALVPTSY